MNLEKEALQDLVNRQKTELVNEKILRLLLQYVYAYNALWKPNISDTQLELAQMLTNDTFDELVKLYQIK